MSSLVVSVAGLGQGQLIGRRQSVHSWRSSGQEEARHRRHALQKKIIEKRKY